MPEGRILLVDDSENDLLLMKHAAEAAGVDTPILCLRDGQEAVDYLSGACAAGESCGNQLPCLVITDLKMPRLDGFDVLEYMAAKPELDSIPRLVLSSSSQEKDRKRATDLGACAYFEKPLRLDELVGLMRNLDTDWFSKHCPKSPPRRN